MVAGGRRRRLCEAVSGGCGSGCWTALMMRAVAGGGTLPSGGFNFRPNRPSGCGDTGVSVVGQCWRFELSCAAVVELRVELS